MFEQITKFANEATTTINKSVTDANKSVADAVNDVSDTITDAVNAGIKDNDIAGRFTSTSDQVLDAVLDTNRRVVDFAVTTADRINEQIKLDVPFADSFPTPTGAGERYLEFVERAVSLNRDMNQRVAEMITVDNAKAAAEQAPAKKATARKSPAKKRPAKKTVAKKAAASK